VKCADRSAISGRNGLF